MKGVYAVHASTEVATPACTSSFVSDLDGHASLDLDEFVELWQVLSTVADPRDPRGVPHAFATILTLAIGAVLAGARSVAGIAARTADLPLHSDRIRGSDNPDPVGVDGSGRCGL